jgi:hypothetical protein
LSTADVSTWMCHPGDPKVLDSIENAIGLPPKALANSRNSMRENGDMSSVSVLDRRNATWSIAHGGKEFDRNHYPTLPVMHGLPLVACIVEVWALHRPFIP